MSIEKIKNIYYKTCLIGMSAGLIIGAIAGLAITAASPAILGYCAARAIGRRLTT